jgi:hypothetical protein
MPTYEFLDTETDEIFEVFMKWSDREEFLKENPQYQPLLSAPNIVSGVTGSKQNRVPDGFKEVLSKISENNKYGHIADKHGKRGIKEAKVREVIDKHVDRVSKRAANKK